MDISDDGHRRDRPQVTVLAVGGTGESYAGDRRTAVTGLLCEVTAGLDDRFVSRWVGYPASYGPAPHLDGMSYRRSVDIGARALTDALRDTPGPIVLIGYSQGAVVIRTALNQLALNGLNGPDSDEGIVERLLAIGFVADPHQPPGAVAGCHGWGVAGPGPDLPDGVATYWVGAAEDVICNAAADSFIRDIADLTAALAVDRVRDWVGDMWTTLRRNTFQNARRTSPGPAQVRRDVGRLSSAAREVIGYLPGTLAWRGVRVRNRHGGRHTSYASEPYRRGSVTDPDTTGCQALAAWLQVCATFSPVGDAVSSVELAA